MMSRTNAINLFYGGNVNGSFFTNATFNSSDYESGVIENSNIIKLLMTSGNYPGFKNNMSATTSERQSENDIHQEFMDFIISTALCHREIFLKPVVDSSLAQSIVNNVYKNFTSLDEDVQGFYKAMVCPCDESGKETYESDKITQLKLKESDSPDTSIFYNCLPVLSESGKLWVSTKNKNLQCFVHDGSRKTLRNLYKSIFSNSGFTDLATRITNVVSANITEREDMRRTFTIKPSKLILGEIHSADKDKDLMVEPTADMANYSFLDGIDMAYGKKWVWDNDKKQYYRFENEQKVYYDDTSIDDAATCYATYLKGDPTVCRRFIECIADGDTTSLKRCLDFLGDKNLFEIAREDVFNVHPKIISAMASKLGMRKCPKTGKLPSIAQWVSEIESSEIKEVVSSNPKLLSYLRGLVAVWNNSVDTINKTNRTSSSLYAKELGKKHFYLATTRGQKRDRLTNLFSELRPEKQTNTRLTAMLHGLMSNAIFTGSSRHSPILSGGHSNANAMCGNTEDKTCISKYGGMLQSLETGLDDVGIKLSDEDRYAIRKYIKTTEENEIKLEKIMNVLQNFIRIASTYGMDLSNQSTDIKSVLNLERLYSDEDVKAFLATHIEKLKTKIQEGLKKNYDMMHSLTNVHLRNILKMAR